MRFINLGHLEKLKKNLLEQLLEEFFCNFPIYLIFIIYIQLIVSSLIIYI